MQYVNLGRTGLQVSRLWLGCLSFGSKSDKKWVVGEEEARRIIKRSLELGINSFDTANAYSFGQSEEIVGRALKDFANRDEVVIATKVYYPIKNIPNQGGLSRKHIFSQIDASLKRLGTDYVDLYQIHRWDYHTPIEETLEALNDLVRMGKVLYIGASSMFAWQFTKALYIADSHGWSRFVSMQNHYNLIYREEEREMLPLCRAEGIGVVPWSPLARGFLAGNRTRNKGGQTLRAKTDAHAKQMYYSEEDFDVSARVLKLAKRKKVKPTQVALAWLLHKPGITAPVLGIRTLEHLDDAVAALDLDLSADDQKYLEMPYKPHAVLGHQ